VHSHSFHANILARLLTIGVPGVPRAVVISSVHNVYEGGWMRMLAYRLTDRWTVRTVAISQAAAERFVRLKAIPKHKCCVRALGIDTQKFAPDAERRASTRKTMRADATFVWLCAGRIAPAKDYPNLLRAFAIRGYGLLAVEVTARAKNLNPWPVIWAFVKRCIFWDCSATCRHCWTRQMDLRSVQPGKGCRR
jgi:glycosyltransferase involved in cell wall biosynthesis